MVKEFSGSIWGSKPKNIDEAKKKPLLTPKEVSHIIDKLKNQDTYAPYEKKLLNACYEWLKNYNRRKY